MRTAYEVAGACPLVSLLCQRCGSDLSLGVGNEKWLHHGIGGLPVNPSWAVSSSVPR